MARWEAQALPLSNLSYISPILSHFKTLKAPKRYSKTLMLLKEIDRDAPLKKISFKDTTEQRDRKVLSKGLVDSNSGPLVDVAVV